MFRSLSVARWPALPAGFCISVAVVLGSGWSPDPQNLEVRRDQAVVAEVRRPKGPVATTRFAPFDLNALSLSDFGDLDRH